CSLKQTFLSVLFRDIPQVKLLIPSEARFSCDAASLLIVNLVSTIQLPVIVARATINSTLSILHLQPVIVAGCSFSSILPIASSCCTEVSHHISRRLLERVNACSIQRADGDCDLAAVIPHNHMLKRWMRASQVKTGKGNPCRKSDSKSHTPRKHGSQSHKAPDNWVRIHCREVVSVYLSSISGAYELGVIQMSPDVTRRGRASRPSDALHMHPIEESSEVKADQRATYN
ncbi:hypothetical protein U0070_019249, partial [Myodes glareolus]